MTTKYISKIFIILICIILISPYVYSAPAVKSISTSNYGLDIEHPLADNFKVGETHKFHFHVFDSNNSKAIMTNMGYNCSFHLYNQTGAHLFKNNNNVDSDDNLDWEQIITGNNFSKSGTYAFVFQCNNSFQGGYYTHDFLVTPAGFDITTSTALIYTLFMAILFMLFMFLLYRSYNGKTLPAKISYFNIAYLIWVVLVFIVYRLSNDYLYSLYIISDIVYYAFLISLILLPIEIIVSFAFLVEAAFINKKRERMSTMGYKSSDINKRM